MILHKILLNTLVLVNEIFKFQLITVYFFASKLQQVLLNTEEAFQISLKAHKAKEHYTTQLADLTSKLVAIRKNI